MTNFSDSYTLSSSLHSQLKELTGYNPKTLDDGRILIMPLPRVDYNRIASPVNLSLWQRLMFGIWSLFASLPPCLDRLPEASSLGYKDTTIRALQQAKEAIDFLRSAGYAASVAVVEIDWVTVGMLTIQLVDYGVVIERSFESKKSSVLFD